MTKQLYDWQKEAITNYRRNNYRGIICAVTGSGKTFVAVTAMKELKQKTIIVVPTIALMNQWHKELVSNGFKQKDIGLYYGKEKKFNKITIAVINSVYELTNLQKKFSLLVVDEIHRLGASQFQRLLLNNEFKYSIGLTATLKREDGAEKLLEEKVGEIIYNYTNKEALDDEVINRVELINIGITLSEKEKNYIKGLSEQISKLMESFDNDMGKVISSVKKRNHYAAKVLKLINERKKFFNNSYPKIQKCKDLIIELYNRPLIDNNRALYNNKDNNKYNDYNTSSYTKPLNSNNKSSNSNTIKALYNKIIVFGEYIETIDTLYKELKEEDINSYVYYSGNKKSLFNLNTKDKKELLDNYENDNKGLLLTVKALDEGLNVDDINVGFILGYNKTTRQAIQRMGRVLRKDDAGKAVMYNFYYRDTSDYWNAKNLSEHFEKIGVVRWK